MAKVNILVARCKGCGFCVEVCPQECLVMDEDLNVRGVHSAGYDESIGECLGCMKCALICPDMAVEVLEDG